MEQDEGVGYLLLCLSYDELCLGVAPQHVGARHHPGLPHGPSYEVPELGGPDEGVVGRPHRYMVDDGAFGGELLALHHAGLEVLGQVGAALLDEEGEVLVLGLAEGGPHVDPGGDRLEGDLPVLDHELREVLHPEAVPPRIVPHDPGPEVRQGHERLHDPDPGRADAEDPAQLLLAGYLLVLQRGGAADVAYRYLADDLDVVVPEPGLEGLNEARYVGRRVPLALQPRHQVVDAVGEGLEVALGRLDEGPRVRPQHLAEPPQPTQVHISRYDAAPRVAPVPPLDVLVHEEHVVHPRLLPPAHNHRNTLGDRHL